MSATTDKLPFQDPPSHLDGQAIIAIQPAVLPGFNPETHSETLRLKTVAHVMLADGREVFGCRFCWRHFDTPKQATAHMGSHGKRVRPQVTWTVKDSRSDHAPEPEPEPKIDDRASKPRSYFPCPQCGQLCYVTPFTAGREAFCEPCGSEFEINAATSETLPISGAIAGVIHEFTRLREEALVINGVLRRYIELIDGALTTLQDVARSSRGVSVSSDELAALREKAEKFNLISRHVSG